MNIKLRYGRKGLTIHLPEPLKVTVVSKKPIDSVSNPPEAVDQALTNPVAAEPLIQLATSARSACILICDITRPVPNGLFIGKLVRALLEGGLLASEITILVATGLHRPNLGEELAELVDDPWVLETIRIENHFARKEQDHVHLGFTSVRRTPIKLDRRFVEADLKIVTGLVEPHFMAGFSGGRKVIAPGIAHADTIRTFHSARFMEDPAAIQCNLENNPLHEEQLEIVKRLGKVYALNTIIDEDRRLIYLNFGEIIQSHLEAVAFVEDSTAVPVPRRFKTVVTSAAGYPLDQTYYQTVKGMVTPMDIMAPGANLIVASDCSEGLGSEPFRASQHRLIEIGPDRFLESILYKPLADIDEWQTEMQLKPMRVARIHLYSEGLPATDWASTGVNRIDSIEEAVRASVLETGDPAVAVIPEGPYVIPYFAP